MTVTWRFKNSETLTFDFVHPGQSFLWEGDLFIRTTKGNMVVAPNTGELYKFEDEDEVLVVEAEIVVSTNELVTNEAGA